jgi:hypothetical protein
VINDQDQSSLSFCRGKGKEGECRPSACHRLPLAAYFFSDTGRRSSLRRAHYRQSGDGHRGQGSPTGCSEESHRRNRRHQGVIKRLEEDRLYPVRMLDEVNALVPPKDIQLTKVSEQGPRVSIEGVGRDNIAVALFMKSLELSKYIQSVDLISSKQVDMSGVKVNQFSLSCVKKRS